MFVVACIVAADFLAGLIFGKDDPDFPIRMVKGAFWHRVLSVVLWPWKLHRETVSEDEFDPYLPEPPGASPASPFIL